jgi:predicted TIM-barrel fold metal-dependent hydrolase
MDETGVDVAVMLPTFAPFLVYDDAIAAERSRGYARAYNRWLADFCAPERSRLWGAALLSRHDPATMTEDLDEALRLGLRSVVMRPNPVRGSTLGAPAYRRFWRACEEQSVSVLLHEGTHTRVATAGADRFESHFAQHACSHPMEAMMAFLSMLEAGVFKAHSGLRVGFLESGCTWLPYWLWRLDHVEFPQYAAELRSVLQRAPSTYFRGQCWIAAEPSEPLLGPAISEIDASRVVFGTDFPHLDHSPTIVRDMVTLAGSLDEDQVRGILWDNPCAMLGVDSREATVAGQIPLHPPERF